MLSQIFIFKKILNDSLFLWKGCTVGLSSILDTTTENKKKTTNKIYLIEGKGKPEIMRNLQQIPYLFEVQWGRNLHVW